MENELSNILRQQRENEDDLKMKKEKLKELLEKRNKYSIITQNVEIVFYIFVLLIIVNLTTTAFIIYDSLQ